MSLENDPIEGVQYANEEAGKFDVKPHTEVMAFSPGWVLQAPTSLADECHFSLTISFAAWPRCEQEQEKEQDSIGSAGMTSYS